MSRSLVSGDVLLDAYCNSMTDFVRLCSEMTIKAIEQNKYSEVYIGDVEEIVQRVCYLLLKNEVSRERFEKNGSKMYAYVYVVIKSCIVRLYWGRNKYGDTYTLK